MAPLKHAIAEKNLQKQEDHELLSVLQLVNYDIIAAKGKYHKACHASYVSKINIKRKKRDASTKVETHFNEAVNWLVKTTTPEIEKVKTYDMNVLPIILKKVESIGNASDNYTKKKLKARLIAHNKEHLVFHQPPQISKPEIVYGSSISLIDVLNVISNCPPPSK